MQTLRYTRALQDIVKELKVTELIMFLARFWSSESDLKPGITTTAAGAICRPAIQFAIRATHG